MHYFRPDYSAAELVSLTTRADADTYVLSLRELLEGLRHRILKRANRAGKLSDETIAQAFTHHAVRAWWGHKCQGYAFMSPLRQPWVPMSDVEIDPTTASLLATFGRRAALCTAPETAYQIGQLYTSLLPSHIKRSQSLYYTPPALARKLVQMATDAGTDFGSVRILEPSCGGGGGGGGGVVLTTVLRAMAVLEGNGSAAKFLQELPKRLVGVDKDPFGAWLAQVMIDGMLFLTAVHCNADLPVVVQIRDFLAPFSDQKYDLVIGNPPFGRLKLDDTQRSRFSRSITGHANIYKLFFDQGRQGSRGGNRGPDKRAAARRFRKKHRDHLGRHQ